MHHSLSLLLLSSIFFTADTGFNITQYQLDRTSSNQIQVAETNRNSAKNRDEKDLQQKAIAQGYQLNDAQIDPQDLDRETHLYQVSVKDPTTLKVDNYCSPDKDGIAKAMLLSGSWDETGQHISDRLSSNGGNVTVACTSGVIAKCVRWGYKPWKQVNGVSLRDYHQACTRMARADYCGNGISHTKDGTLIDVYDRLKIQQPETETNGLTLEAAWGVDGALWLNHTRYPDTLSQLQQECPDKLQQIYNTGKTNLTSGNIEAQIPTALIFNNSQNYNYR